MCARGRASSSDVSGAWCISSCVNITGTASSLAETNCPCGDKQWRGMDLQSDCAAELSVTHAVSVTWGWRDSVTPAEYRATGVRHNLLPLERKNFRDLCLLWRDDLHG